MKKLLLAAIAVFAMLLTTACSKELVLEGTIWTGSFIEKNDATDSDMRTYDLKMNFATANTGTWNIKMTQATLEDGETVTNTEAGTLDFGYTISGNAVNITTKSIDDPETLYFTGVVNDDHDELTVSIDANLVKLKKQK